MKTQTLRLMQKAAKLVIKYLNILFCTFIFQGYSQEYSTDDHIILDKVITMTAENDETDYSLNIRKAGSSHFLDKYYNFRKHEKPFYTVVQYDSISDKIGYDTLKLKEDIIRWKRKYKTLDSIFDLEAIIDITKNNTITYWDTTDTFFKKERNFNYCKPIYYCDHSISSLIITRIKNMLL